MRKCYLSVAAILLSVLVHGQIQFTETFGQTTTRQTSPYMPAGSFAWSDPNGTANEKMIENNHYAVIAPANIVDAYPTPAWWFWTGPEPVGNTGGGTNNPSTPNNNADHTGDADGAVLVVNAGSTLQDFYRRSITLVPGECYRLSFYFYLVNSPARIKMGIRDAITKVEMGSYTSPDLYTEDFWGLCTYDSKYPATCPANANTELFLKNDLAENNGNDYYIDDLVFEQITCYSTEPDLNCVNLTILSSTPGVISVAGTGCETTINWVSEEEEDIREYILESGMDGYTFRPYMTVSPKGSGNTYELPLTPQRQARYIRLKTQYRNGTYKYSRIVSVSNNCSLTDGAKIISPVTNGLLTVIAGSNTTKADLTITAADGRIVMRKIISSGTNQLPVQQLPKGVYLALVEQNGKRSGHRFVVQ